jgi:hypothetical protein
MIYGFNEKKEKVAISEDGYQFVTQDGEGNVDITGDLGITGNLNVGGDLEVTGSTVLSEAPTIGSHNSVVGTSVSYTPTDVRKVSSPTSLGSVTVDAGLWVIVGYVTFAGTTNAQGYRRACISSTANHMSLQSFGVSSSYVSGNTIAVATPFLIARTTEQETFYLNASAVSDVIIANRNMYALRLL